MTTFAPISVNFSDGRIGSACVANASFDRVHRTRVAAATNAFSRGGDAPFAEIQPERSRQVVVSVSRMSAYQAQLRPSASSRTRSRVPTSSADE